MPSRKKQPKPTLWKKLSTISRKHKWLTALFVIVILATSIHFIQNELEKKTLRDDRRLLDNVARDMDLVYGDISPKLAIPDEITKDKSCVYPSSDSFWVDPSCGPYYYIVYGVDTKKDGTDFIKDFYSAVVSSEHTRVTGVYPYEPINLESTESSVESLNVGIEDIRGVRCSLSADLDDVLGFNPPKIQNPYYVAVRYDCSKTEPDLVYKRSD